MKEPKAKSFLLSNWYRPPNSPIELFDKFETLPGKIEVENIVSDINCNMMAATPANETRHRIELCESCQYAQLIKEPTRVASSSNHLSTYFLLMSQTNLLHQACLILAAAITVQSIYVSRKLTCLRSLPRIIESRQSKNFVPDDFMNDMSLVPWDIIEQIDNPISAWEVWKQSFLTVS